MTLREHRGHEVSVDLRIALFTATGDEPSMLAWRCLLEAEQMPYDVVRVGERPLTAETLQHTSDHGRYQALVLATDRLLRCLDGAFVTALGVEEWALLAHYERTFGVRRISAYATPSPDHGLTSATMGRDVGGTVAALTAAGRHVFPYLRGPVPISPRTYGYPNSPLPGAAFTTLVTAADASPVVGVVAHCDNREELVVTVATGAHSEHLMLLGHGLLSWATRHRCLDRHFYLSVHVDDVLLSSHRADDDDESSIRMSADDVEVVAAWSVRHNFRLDLAFNAWGAVRAEADGNNDPLTSALRSRAAEFGWINHTFDHRDLDGIGEAQARDEIVQNLAWAAENRIDVEPDSLVTGGHSGLRNPAIGRSLDECGVRFVAADASRPQQVDPEALGRALAVPRHPINIPVSVSTRTELLQFRTALGHAAPPESLFEIEARLMLNHVLGNDPRPHFAHQNALTDDRLLLELLEFVLESYHRLLDVPLLSPTLSAIGAELRRRERWRELLDGDGVRATVRGQRIDIVNHTEESIEVPAIGAVGGRRPDGVDWVRLDAGARWSVACS